MSNGRSIRSHHYDFIPSSSPASSDGYSSYSSRSSPSGSSAYMGPPSGSGYYPSTTPDNGYLASPASSAGSGGGRGSGDYGTRGPYYDEDGGDESMKRGGMGGSASVTRESLSGTLSAEASLENIHRSHSDPTTSIHTPDHRGMSHDQSDSGRKSAAMMQVGPPMRPNPNVSLLSENSYPPTNLPPQGYNGPSPFAPAALQPKIYGSQMDRLPGIEGRMEEIERRTEELLRQRAARALQNATVSDDYEQEYQRRQQRGEYRGGNGRERRGN